MYIFAFGKSMKTGKAATRIDQNHGFNPRCIGQCVPVRVWPEEIVKVSKAVDVEKYILAKKCFYLVFVV
jgi:hypothetical protein